jgi:peptidyl-prolyl cis-trans isomerase D
VQGVTPARERTLDEVKDRVEARWRDDQVAERLRNKAKELVDKLNAGTSMADLAQADGLKVETVTGLKRGKPAEGIASRVLEEVFKTPKGSAATAEGQNATERTIFRVTDIAVPELDPASADAKRIDDELKKTLADDLMGQYLLRLQNDIGVSINQSALRQVTGGGEP